MVVFHYRLLLKSDITTTLTYSNKTGVAYDGDTSFNSYMVIIMAALLCAIGPYSIVRCALVCYSHETADVVTACLASTCLKKEVANQIPVVVSKPGLDVLATDCPICLAEFVGEDVRILPRCKPGFDVKCI